MDNLAPANVDPSELPSGFTTGNPTGGASAEQQNQAQQRKAQRDAILEQALTPDALERLKRIKVIFHR
jgi:programmed cell death protein 5